MSEEGRKASFIQRLLSEKNPVIISVFLIILGVLIGGFASKSP